VNTLEFARRFIRFDKSSPITGPFRDEFYPFLRAPMAAADDIRVKRLVIYKASSAMGTVLGQILNLKRIVCDVGDQLMICQTDDDASVWSKTRGKEWVKANADAMRLLSRDKYSMNNDLWLFRHKFLGITGPGINAAQSVQVRYVQSDESHLDAYPPGRLVEFEKRMGGRWDRQATHITTAPDAGKEVDKFFEEGQQDEWHFRCPQCAHLIAPLWGEYAREKYGLDLFVTVADSSIWFRCPFCSNAFMDTSRDRYALVKDGDYVSANPSAPIHTRSFRWSAFAAHWISWGDLLVEHWAAMAAARLGDLKPHEDWCKKRLAVAYIPTLPDFGDGKGADDYRLGDVWECGESERFMGIDRQAGKGDEGEHLWVLIVQYDRAGNSRRLAYRKVQTFAQAEALAVEFEVKPFKTYCDSGYENRSTFRECGKRNWLTTRGSDEVEFMHTKEIAGETRNFSLPYSPWTLQSGNIGQKSQNIIRKKGSRVPPGWAWQLVMANPTLYGYLAANIGGSSGRYFGIAADMPDEYRKNMPAFIMVSEPDKKTGTIKKVIWKKVREDHAWDCEVQCLLGAIRSGFHPLAKEAHAFNSAPVISETAQAISGD
jgi:hypothetical protein